MIRSLTPFDFGFMISDCGSQPQSEIINPKYTEGVNLFSA